MPATSHLRSVGPATVTACADGIPVATGWDEALAGLAFGIAAMKTNLVESVNSIIGLVGGPMLGLFLLGIFTKKVDTRGALIGCLAGFAVLIFLFLYKTAPAPGMTPTVMVSFLWFTMIGCLVTMAVGWITSSRSAPR